jgi:hypothetical protein
LFLDRFLTQSAQSRRGVAEKDLVLTKKKTPHVSINVRVRYTNPRWFERIDAWRYHNPARAGLLSRHPLEQVARRVSPATKVNRIAGWC